MAQPPTSQRSDFNAYKDTYREAVQDSISFSGLDVDALAEHKAVHLQAIARRHLGDPGRLAALDLGCGVGATDRFLTETFATLQGVDVAAEAVKRAAEANPAVTYSAYDGQRLPFDDASFDLAFTINVLHHVPPRKRERFAAEMSRVLRPGGLAVVIEHNPFNPLTRLAVWRCDFDEDAVLLTSRGASRLLAGAGLRPTERRYMLFAPLRADRAVAVDQRLGRLPLGGQHYLAARREAHRAPAPRV